MEIKIKYNLENAHLVPRFYRIKVYANQQLVAKFHPVGEAVVECMPGDKIEVKYLFEKTRFTISEGQNYYLIQNYFQHDAADMIFYLFSKQKRKLSFIAESVTEVEYQNPTAKKLKTYTLNSDYSNYILVAISALILYLYASKDASLYQEFRSVAIWGYGLMIISGIIDIIKKVKPKSFNNNMFLIILAMVLIFDVATLSPYIVLLIFLGIALAVRTQLDRPREEVLL
jgi:hypothetical protein